MTITPRSHRLIDYLSVAVFAVAPFALGLEGVAAVTAYALAGVHLVLTVVTRFPVASADRRPMPFAGHGALEILVGIVLLLVPWMVPGFSLTARVFFSAMGAVITLVWKLTPYHAGDEAAAAGPAAGEPRGPQPPPRP